MLLFNLACLSICALLCFLIAVVFPTLFRAFPLLCPTSVLRKGTGKGERGKRMRMELQGLPIRANSGCVSCAASYGFLSSLRPKWDAMTIRSHLFLVSYFKRHKMTRLVRQSVYQHSRGHRSILGPGRVQTCNICSVLLWAYSLFSPLRLPVAIVIAVRPRKVVGDRT
jgi:hypothetical protein